jgi:hypothetical protein
VLRDRIVQTDQAAIDQQQRRQGDHRLAHRIDIDQGLRGPGPGPPGVGPALPQVHHQLAVAPHRQGRAAARFRRESLPDGLVSSGDKTLDIAVR